MATFVTEREWNKFHTPRNVLLALVGEVGEVAEHFQWKHEVPIGLPEWTDQEKINLSEELADVQLYLVRLSNLCRIDLSQACLRKMQLNRQKYPVDKCKGSAAKYTAYVEDKETVTKKMDNNSSSGSSSSSNDNKVVTKVSTLSSVSSSLTVSSLIMGSLMGIVIGVATSFVVILRYHPSPSR